jgi:toxin FitB
MRRFRAVLNAHEPVDEAVAESYGILASRVVKAGRQPRTRVMDLLIAATAHAHGASLYTRNREGLRGLDDLVEIAAV